MRLSSYMLPRRAAYFLMLPLYATRYTTNLRGWTMPLKKSFDMLADLGMTGRIGMDTVH